MFGLVLALMFAVGVSGTVQKADTALPGDAFFGLDQAVEGLRMKLADEDKGYELRLKFAEERISEIETLLRSGSSAAELDKNLTEEEEARIHAGIDAALDLLAGLDEKENLEVTGAMLRLNEYTEALMRQ